MIQRRNFIGGMAAILAGAAAPAYIRHAMPVKMVGSIAVPTYVENLAASMRYIKHEGVGLMLGNTFFGGTCPTHPLGVVYAFNGEKLPPGWEYCDSPV